MEYRELTRLYPLSVRLRERARAAVIAAASPFLPRSSSGEWIRFPYYHHVFDDERAGFERHLRFFKMHGEVLSIDDAVSLLREGGRLGGRYFCVTFDDGFKNCATNALPILISQGCRAAFFVSSGLAGCPPDREPARQFFITCRSNYPLPIEFLGWNDCRALLEGGMTVGSHGVDHVRLSGLSEEAVRSQLVHSKSELQARLGVPCLHFGCPWGNPGSDYPDYVPRLARDAGYDSFLTTLRGANPAGADPYAIRRDHLLAGMDEDHLRYFLLR